MDSHFINEEGKLQALLLTLIEIERAHTGEQLAVQMFMVLNQYYIKDCLSVISWHVIGSRNLDHPGLMRNNLPTLNRIDTG